MDDGFSIVVDTTKAEALLKDYPKRANQAVYRALNRAIASVRTLIIRVVAQDLGLKQKEIRDKLTVTQAKIGRPWASLAASRKRLPLILFGAKGDYPSRGKGKGVTYRMRGSSGRLPHAFMAVMRSGHVGIFERARTSRLPIRELHGPSIGQLLEVHKDEALDKGRTAFEVNLLHELKFAAEQAGGQSAGVEFPIAEV